MVTEVLNGLFLHNLIFLWHCRDLLQYPYQFDANFNDWLHKKLELNFVIVDLPFCVSLYLTQWTRQPFVFLQFDWWDGHCWFEYSSGNTNCICPWCCSSCSSSSAPYSAWSWFNSWGNSSNYYPVY